MFWNVAAPLSRNVAGPGRAKAARCQRGGRLCSGCRAKHVASMASALSLAHQHAVWASYSSTCSRRPEKAPLAERRHQGGGSVPTPHSLRAQGGFLNDWIATRTGAACSAQCGPIERLKPIQMNALPLQSADRVKFRRHADWPGEQHLCSPLFVLQIVHYPRLTVATSHLTQSGLLVIMTFNIK